MLCLENESDQSIWTYAKQHNYTIVTFDANFADISCLKGFPPKIIWLRMGNMTTNHIASHLIKNQDIIKLFINSE